MSFISKMDIPVVYIDESGVNEYYQREYARAPRGEKVNDTKKGKKFGRTNVIGAYCNGRKFAVECYKHSINSAFFEEWFRYVLLPELPQFAVVVLDNATFHSKKVLQEIADENEITLLFLPPYSPDFNKIEKIWANLKRWLRTNLVKFKSVVEAVFAFFDVK